MAARHPNQSVLTHEHQWPIDTGFADRLIIMHGLETSEYPSMMLDEALRVLGPGGKALLLFPTVQDFGVEAIRHRLDMATLLNWTTRGAIEITVIHTGETYNGFVSASISSKKFAKNRSIF